LNQLYTFTKEERISSRTEISLLFEKGTGFIAYPFRVLFVEKQPVAETRAAVLISVPKRKFKLAVKRNGIKRLVRENYRLNKNDLTSFLENRKTGLLIAFLFVGNEMPDCSSVESAVKKAFDELKNRLLCAES